MRKLGIYGKLPLIGLVAGMLLSCDSNDVNRLPPADEQPMPDLLTVEEFMNESSPQIGRRVSISGFVVGAVESGYFLQSQVTSDATQRVSLIFEKDNIDMEKFSLCVGQESLVTGYSNDEFSIRVQYVDLMTDKQPISTKNCYWDFE